MSLYDLEHYLYRLKRDPVLQADYLSDPAHHLATQKLSPEQRDALGRKDLAALWAMGVHPLLLAPLGRLFGLTPEQFRQVLRPVAHLREFHS